MFSTGSREMVFLTIYLLVLQAAGLVVFYTTRTGGQWWLARWIGLAGTWGLIAAACSDAPVHLHLGMMGLLPVAYLLSGVWTWLPRHPDLPKSPGSLWAVANLALIGSTWVLWDGLNWPETWFSIPLLATAGIAVLLIRPLRRRMEGSSADFTLFAVGAAALMLAVPVAIDERWLTTSWGAFALAMTLASSAATTRSAP